MVYEMLSQRGLVPPLLLYQNKVAVSSTIAGFAFTMLGFMASIVAVLFAFTGSENFRAYSRKGYLTILFGCYFLCIGSLVVTALLAVGGLSSGQYVSVFRWMLISFVNNLVQIIIVTTVIINLARKSMAG